MVSDEILMIEFQRGSRPAFDELYSRYSGPLYGFFRHRTQNPQKAEDQLATIRLMPNMPPISRSPFSSTVVMPP
jgi:DNA-directed RNA polymerase specialized sigma24 family protein